MSVVPGPVWGVAPEPLLAQNTRRDVWRGMPELDFAILNSFYLRWLGPLTMSERTYHRQLTAHLEAGFRNLRFAPELEGAFREAYRRGDPARRRIALLAGALVYFSFGIAGLVSGDPAASGGALVARIGVIWPALIAALILSWHPAWVRRLDTVAMFVLPVVAIGHSAMLALVHARGEPIPADGLLLLVMFIYLLTGLRFYRALACGLAVPVIYVAAELLAGGLTGAALAYNGFYLLAANVVGAAGCYGIEHQARRNFLRAELLRHLAAHDSLTGLRNQRSMREELDVALRRARREGQPLAVAMIDIDRFKAFNDRHGHQAGDQALVSVAATLAEGARRPLDLAGRYGGEEFTLVWYGVDADNAAEMAHALQAEIRELTVATASGEARLTVSVGIAAGVPAAGDSPDGYLACADAALYQAKADGRDCCVILDACRKTGGGASAAGAQAPR